MTETLPKKPVRFTRRELLIGMGTAASALITGGFVTVALAGLAEELKPDHKSKPIKNHPRTPLVPTRSGFHR